MWNHPESHPGEYLRVRFLQPLRLSASALAVGCRMPRSRVSDLLSGKRGISTDTAMRLGAFFRMEPEQWLALQSAWDLAQVEVDRQIVPLDPPEMLLGPLGATPIPQRRVPRPAPQPPIGARPRIHVEIRYSDGTRALVSTDSDEPK